MIAIPIKSESYGEKLVFIDGEDFNKFNAHKWSVNHSRNNCVISKTKGRNRKGLKLHRIIMDCKDNEIVDHIDGNPLNNTRANLRICTKSENCRNRKLNKNSTTNYKGVSFCKTHLKYKARITLNGKRKSLGYFKNEIDAAKAYNKAAEKLYGEFARLNIIEE